jgi:hypothetical protein
LAVHLSNSQNTANGDDRNTILQDLRAQAKPFSNHNQNKWGNGTLQIIP